MPYISELLNNTITDSSDLKVGKLEDILIVPKEGTFEPLEFLVIKTKGGLRKFVPYEFVENFTSSQISLKNQFSKIALDALPLGKQFVALKKEVLDKQIVDVGGTRVVRVNDLRIGNFENKTCVLGIDASFKGLVRRLGLAETFFARPFDSRLIDWRQAKLLEGGAELRLDTAAESLSRLHPADLANLVEDLDVKQGSRLLTSLSSDKAARVLEEVEPEVQTILVKYLGTERAGQILAHMSSDELVDLVKTLSEPEARAILSKAGPRGRDAEKLIDYEDNTAGGLMTLDYFAARPDWTVEQTSQELRNISPKLRSIVYVYVASENGKFEGVVSLRRLILAEKTMTLKQLVKKTPQYSALKPQDTLSRVIKLMTKYNLYTAAVTDREKKLVGVVTIDDVMRQLYPNA